MNENILIGDHDAIASYLAATARELGLLSDLLPLYSYYVTLLCTVRFAFDNPMVMH